MIEFKSLNFKFDHLIHLLSIVIVLIIVPFFKHESPKYQAVNQHKNKPDIIGHRFHIPNHFNRLIIFLLYENIVIEAQRDGLTLLCLLKETIEILFNHLYVMGLGLLVLTNLHFVLSFFYFFVGVFGILFF